jgi:hypothetical protein
MEFDSPTRHKQIVDDLMNGKFILSREAHFEDIRENTEYYEKFFKSSFGYDFVFTQEFAYILSSETAENLSKDISIFMAILCYG